MANRKKSDKQELLDWEEFARNISSATPIDTSESVTDKKKRIEYLEKHPEEWFKYYFPNFYTSEPAPFHKRATKRVLNNPEWFEVRNWARELAKSTRGMMEDLNLMLRKKKRFLLMVSSTYDNAERLLKPYKITLESNNRIINDYGVQRRIGSWEDGDFKTKSGAAFIAIGAGQSPRGLRNEEIRPDIIRIDDIDTDEECRNKKRIDDKVNWVERALLATRSISRSLLVVVSGNIIAKYCTVVLLSKKADHVDIVNIRDKHGKSTWPQKNSEAAIDRVLSTISYAAGQSEYFNNPIKKGAVFKKMNYGKCPPLRTCEFVLVYSDPATSNKEKSTNSTKGVCVIGYKNLKYYVYRVWLDHVRNATFVDWLFEAYRYMSEEKVDTKRIHIENNTLQDPHYEQVILPLVYKSSRAYGFNLPITPDTRKKPDKFHRIEGTLEPINRLGNLVFNEEEKGTVYMDTMEDQFLGVDIDSKTMDGPDTIEGGVWIIQNRQEKKKTTFRVGPKANRRY